MIVYTPCCQARQTADEDELVTTCAVCGTGYVIHPKRVTGMTPHINTYKWCRIK